MVGSGWSPATIGLRKVPSPRSALRWPSNPFPQRGSPWESSGGDGARAPRARSGAGRRTAAPPARAPVSAVRRSTFIMPGLHLDAGAEQDRAAEMIIFVIAVRIDVGEAVAIGVEEVHALE